MMLTTLFSLALVMMLVGTEAQQPPHAIKHIIYLIQENRSFDHLLGWLKSENAEVDGLTGAEYNLLNVSDPNSQRFYVHSENPYRTFDPGHGLGSITEQVFGTSDPDPGMAACNCGFAQQGYRQTGDTADVHHQMGSHPRDRLPVSYFLASEFAVFDRWFCSVPASTQPNRMYVHSGTSDGMASNDVPRLVRGLPQDPFLRQVADDGYTWSNYFQQVPSLALLQWPRRPANNYNFAAFQHYSKFKEDLAAGNLANLVFIDPRYTDGREGYLQNDDHPGGSDMVSGQALLKDLYETLRASPLWNSSALVITYDEHGGFYDHVPTPTEGIPNPDGKCTPDGEFCFDRLGVRVPTIVVSPWIQRNTVVHGPPDNMKPFPNSEYEASSLGATIKAMWNLSSDFLTERDRWAGTFHHIFDVLESPRSDCPMTAPDLPPPDLRKYTPNKPIDELQRDFVFMAAGVNGDEAELTSDVLDTMTELQADEYMRTKMAKWLRREIPL